MADCVIPMSSQTTAERAKRAANQERIPVEVVSVDPAVTKRGCAFGIRMNCADTARMMRLMDRKKISYGDVIGGNFYG